MNLDKESVPCMAARLKDPTSGKPLKAKARPLEDNKGYGLHMMALIDATLVDGYGPRGPMINPDEYRKATRKLCSTGLWPNNSNPSNLLSKLTKYNGGTSTYTADNLKKASWYAMEEVATATNTGETTWLFLLQFEMGQFRLYRQENTKRCPETQVCRRGLDLGKGFHSIGFANVGERSSSKNGKRWHSNEHEKPIQVGLQGGSGSARHDRGQDDNALDNGDGHQLRCTLEGDARAQSKGHHNFKLLGRNTNVPLTGRSLQCESEARHC